MAIVRALRNGFKNFFVLGGRSRRVDYWIWLGFVAMAVCSVAYAESAFGPAPLGNGVLAAIVGLVLLVPTLTYTSRRLHDLPMARGAFWLVLIFVPVLGPLILLAWCARGGYYGPNEFGRDPMDVD